jgi:hypothetical protein
MAPWLQGRKGLLDPLLMLAVLLLNVVDLLLTATLIPLGAEELNPIFRPLVHEGRWVLASVIKLTPLFVLFGAVAFLVRRLGHLPWPLAWGVRFLAVEYTLVVAFLTGQLAIVWYRIPIL